jgi:hypothetical protein
VLFVSLAVPTFAIAQDDAGAVAAVEAAAETAPVTAPAPAAEAPAEVAPEVVVADAPAPAVVAPAAQTSLDKLSSELMNILIPVFVTLIGGLAAAFLAWVRKKAKLDVSDKQLNQWKMVAEMAAGRAGEWARNKTKDLTEGKTIPGPDILEVGANWGLDYGIAHGLPDIGREKLEGLIESHLHFRRAEVTPPAS